MREIEEGAPSPLNQSRSVSLSQSIVTDDSYHRSGGRAEEPDSHGDTSGSEADPDCWRDDPRGRATSTSTSTSTSKSLISPYRIQTHSSIRSDSHNRNESTGGAALRSEDGSMHLQPVAHTVSKCDTAAQILRDREEIREQFAVFGGHTLFPNTSSAAATAVYHPSPSTVHCRGGDSEVSDEEMSLSLFDLAR